MRPRLKLDPVLSVLALLLAVTLALYVYDVFPYPFGFVLLSAAIIGRILMLMDRNRQG